MALNFSYKTTYSGVALPKMHERKKVGRICTMTDGLEMIAACTDQSKVKGVDE